MIARAPEPPPFTRLGPSEPRSPVVLAVPHAGREYPAALLAATRLPREKLEALEDRFADRLIDAAVAQGASALVARRARAWIDLNRDPREIDPAMIDPTPVAGLLTTAKVRGGLGLIPRRIALTGNIYSRRIAAADVAARIATDHRPWHEAIEALLLAARTRFGVAILLDIHSMPTTPGLGIILGDRHGDSAAEHLVARIEAEAIRANLPVIRNRPYAGGYSTARHGRPAANVHAIQLEVDRSLYLRQDMRSPAEGLPRIRRFVAAAAAAVADEAIRPSAMLAAE